VNKFGKLERVTGGNRLRHFFADQWPLPACSPGSAVLHAICFGAGPQRDRKALPGMRVLGSRAAITAWPIPPQRIERHRFVTRARSPAQPTHPPAARSWTAWLISSTVFKNPPTRPPLLCACSPTHAWRNSADMNRVGRRDRSQNTVSVGLEIDLAMTPARARAQPGVSQWPSHRAPLVSPSQGAALPD
jgi:hypothetical protein